MIQRLPTICTAISRLRAAHNTGIGTSPDIGATRLAKRRIATPVVDLRKDAEAALNTAKTRNRKRRIRLQ